MKSTSRRHLAGLGARGFAYASLVASPLLAATDLAAQQEKRISLPTGVTINYVEAGRADAPAVILLHGFPDSWHVWQSFIGPLAANHRVFAIDLRGHGESDKPECCYTQADFTADVVAFMNAVGVERAALVGHSLGSFIARTFALTHPGRIERLVLVGSGPGFPGAVGDEIRSLADAATEPQDPETVRAFQRSSFNHEPDPATFALLMQRSAKVPGRVWRHALRGLADRDHTVGLDRIRVPTLILAGDHDGFFPVEVQHALKGLIPGARLTLYADAGHFPHYEATERLRDDLVAFLGEARTTAARDGR